MIDFQVNDFTTAVMTLIDGVKYYLSCTLMESFRKIQLFFIFLLRV